MLESLKAENLACLLLKCCKLILECRNADILTGGHAVMPDYWNHVYWNAGKNVEEC